MSPASRKPELRVGLSLVTIQGRRVKGMSYKKVMAFLAKAGRPLYLVFSSDSWGSEHGQFQSVDEEVEGEEEEVARAGEDRAAAKAASAKSGRQAVRRVANAASAARSLAECQYPDDEYLLSPRPRLRSADSEPPPLTEEHTENPLAAGSTYRTSVTAPPPAAADARAASRGGGGRQHRTEATRPSRPSAREVTVEFAETHGSIGLVFGGRKEGIVPYIRKIVPGSLAAERPELRPGLMLVAVQGITVAGLEYQQALDAISSAGRPVVLLFTGAEVSTDSEGPAAEPPPPGVLIVRFSEKEGSLGVVFGGRKEGITPYIRKILPGSLASRKPELATGLSLVTVQGKPVDGLEYQQVLDAVARSVQL